VPRLVALLRAINVGGHVVKMDALRRHFEAMGLAGVETFIASGNVIFDGAAKRTDELERRIERHLEGALGYPVATFLRTPAELAAVAARRPFGGVDAAAGGGMMSAMFLKAPPDRDAVARVMALRSEQDEFEVQGRELFWWRRTKGMGMLLSMAKLDRAVGGPWTARNVTTVGKLAAKYGAGPS
jgi:uncharacterized protein (DUF1697 family)